MRRILHCYASPWEHEEVLIVGTRPGLRALRDALEEALGDGDGTGAAAVEAGDGEGYAALVVVAEEAQMPRMLMPYSETDDRTDDGMLPAGLFTHERYTALVGRRGPPSP